MGGIILNLASEEPLTLSLSKGELQPFMLRQAQHERPLVPSKGDLGFTLVEIMMAAAAFAIMMAMFSPMFSISQRAFTALEVSSTLKDAGQKALNSVALDLNQCKKLFKNGVPNDALYLNNVLGQLGGMPVPLNGSQLPVNNKFPAISPTDGNFDKNLVGNCLFLASIEKSLNLTALDANGVSRNVRLDIYHFSFYYLAEGQGDLGGKAIRNLWEWHSASFADFSQVDSIIDVDAPNNTLRINTIKSLMDQGIQYAWNPSANYDAAFFEFWNDPGDANKAKMKTVPTFPTPPISKRTGGPAVKILVGTGGGNYRYGVSPNNISGEFGTKHPVPSYAQEAGEFPSGFEVVMAGPTGARMVYVRLVLVAKGDQKITFSKEHVLLVTTQDLF